MRILGLDYGERRVGVAISDPTGAFAQPLETIATPKGDADALARVAELVKTREVGQIVLGLPLHMNGRAGPEADRYTKRYVYALVVFFVTIAAFFAVTVAIIVTGQNGGV